MEQEKEEQEKEEAEAEEENIPDLREGITCKIVKGRACFSNWDGKPSANLTSVT